MTHKQSYTQPKLTKLGSVADLTHAGNTNLGSDFKGGSNDATGPQASNVR